MTQPSTSFGLIGPPGTGKSTFILSACDWAAAKQQKVVVLSCPPREADTYQHHPAAESHRLLDPGFDPLDQSFDASGWLKGMRALKGALKRDDVAGVAIDTLAPGFSDLGMNAALSVFNASSPSEVANGGAYVDYNSKINRTLAYLDEIVESGRFVIVTAHGQMKEQEGQGEAETKKSFGGAEKLAFPDQMLPIMHSKIRQAVPGKFSLWMSAFSEGFKLAKKCYLTTMPLEGIPAKKCVPLKLPKGVLETRIPNDFGLLWQAVQEGRQV